MTTIHLRDHIHGSNNRAAHRFSGQGIKFFKRKPRLVHNEIEKIPVKLTVAWRANENEEHDPTLFNAYIWALRIRNPKLKLSTPIECFAILHIKNVGEDFPLRWKRMEAPSKCVIGERPKDGESFTMYHRLMPYYYAVIELAQRNAARTSSFQVGEEYLLYLLFTYDGSNHAFVISPLEQAQWYKDQIFYPRQNFLIFEKNDEPEITITFKDQNNVEVDRIKLRIKFYSWNNVKIL